MADGDSAVVIYPSGKLGKCEEHLDDLHIGNVETGITEHGILGQMKETEALPCYKECPLYPTCVRLLACKPKEACSLPKAAQRAEAIKLQMNGYYEESLRDDK